MLGGMPAGPETSSPVLLCPELVGRSVEADTLAERSAAAARGRGSLLLIAGDAGVGKSRLVGAFREALAGGRAAVGVGGYGEFANAPFAGILRALRAVGAAEPTAAATTQAEQFAAILTGITELAQRQYVVLVLEDIHWADDASLAFLVYLARFAGKLRLLVVATYRSDELHRTHHAAPFIARLSRDPNVRRLALAPLDRAATERMVRATIAGRLRLPRSEIEEIAERSDGNPFFAEELLRAAWERAVSGTQTDLPATIRAAVAQRLGAFDGEARSVLARAAVVGRRFEPAFLASIAERPPEVVLEVLRAARDRQLVVELQADPPAFVFRHALTREAIYAEMLAAELRPLHRRIVDALESEPGASAADLGYHAWAARDAARTLRYNERAGDEATGLHAHSDGLRAYERALEGADDDDARGRLLAKAAGCSSKDGNPDRAVRLYASALEAYERLGSTERVATLSHYLASEAHAAGDSSRARDVLEHGLRALPANDRSPARVWLAATLAFVHLDAGETNEAAALLARSELAADDAEAGPMYYASSIYLAALEANVARVRTLGTRYVALCERLAPERLLRARYNTGFGLSALGLDAEALEHFEMLLAELRSHRMASLEVIACATTAMIYARTGRLAEGRALVERGLAVGRTIALGRVALAGAAYTLGRMLGDEDLIARTGDPELVEIAFASGIVSTIGRFAGPYARWLADRGRRDEARALLRRALHVLRSPYGATETLLAAAELADVPLLRALDGVSASLDLLAQAPIYAATASHVRALLHREPTSVRGYARDAAARYGTLGWPYHAARCEELVGHSAEALAAFRAIGALVDVRRLELGERPVTEPIDRGGLSPREWEIAELVAAGASNRALAERLAVSQKTVEKHLTSIYDKLGFRSRAELAAYLARRG